MKVNKRVKFRAQELVCLFTNWSTDWTVQTTELDVFEFDPNSSGHHLF